MWHCFIILFGFPHNTLILYCQCHLSLHNRTCCLWYLKFGPFKYPSLMDIFDRPFWKKANTLPGISARSINWIIMCSNTSSAAQRVDRLNVTFMAASWPWVLAAMFVRFTGNGPTRFSETPTSVRLVKRGLYIWQWVALLKDWRTNRRQRFKGKLIELSLTKTDYRAVTAMYA